jgi:putative transposase
LSYLCKLIGKSRQAYYKAEARRKNLQFEVGVLVELVCRERKIAKRIGSNRLHRILKSELIDNNINIGRDKFHAILRDNRLIVNKVRRGPYTTNSNHGMRKYPNLAKNLFIDRSEMLWVSDITYLRFLGGFIYLMLITDSYSRKIVGYNVGLRMTAEFCNIALFDSLESRSNWDRPLIHHSDRGTQYCSKVYTETLVTSNIKISMTENGDPLENPLAERMNRTLKDVFALDEVFLSLEQAKEKTDNAIEYYNDRLPHSSLDMLTPAIAHTKQGYLNKHWKPYWKESLEYEHISPYYTPQEPT